MQQANNNGNFLNINQATGGGGFGANSSNLIDSGNLIPMNKSAKVGNNASGNSNMIFVYGIGPASESDVYSLFSQFGQIQRVNVIKKAGQSKGYGFVQFETYEEACYAVNGMNGGVYNNRPLQVQINSGGSMDS